ncbi:crotonase/enoyl-CoA hydratase family protein [Nitratireductor sp. CAU 1489]|uniref:Crotonase/enoyl-CoA hydratase family protein n=1 Tax=Nitratireductor arenosus TaxID=2682096 RepID=A0A844QHT4_9HYPH|nr:crotonase/enoyl-CoA hydratase family protein [Nitratireductor arenosus]MVA97583.1 crotonase/enoyl-CoA hydratase family protein [Nitratireductor arenosus]
MTALESTFFHVERHGAVVHLVMNRPDRANAMTPDFWTDLPRLIAALGRDETVRCAVISGAGRNFTGGMDLAAFADIARLFEAEPGRAALAMRDLILRLQEAFSALERARFPVIAAAHGACIGAGVDLITACDMRFAAADASFAIEEIHIGMAADVGTLQRLPKLIAPATAAELAYTGRRFSAAEAKGFGLVSHVFDDREALVAGALEQAHAIARKSPLAITGIKRNLTYARDHSVADGLDYIATWNGGMLRSQDLMAAVQAKMAKQDAQFADLLKGEA